MKPFFAFTGIAAVVASAAFPAAASDWSDWQALPDYHQAGIDFRFRAQGGDKKAPATLVYQFRNRYPQRVTFTFHMEGDARGDAQVVDQTVILEPRGTKNQDTTEQAASIAHLDRLQLVSISFDGKEPPVSTAGAQAQSMETLKLQREIAQLQFLLRQADDAHTRAMRSYVATSAEADARRVTRTDSQGNRYTVDKSDVMRAQSQATTAAGTSAGLRKRLESLQKRLVTAQFQATRVVNLVNYGERRMDKGDWLMAETDFRAALVSDAATDTLGQSTRAAVSARLGEALLRQNKIPEALAAWTEAVRLVPTSAAYAAGLKTAQEEAAAAETPTVASAATAAPKP